MVLVYKVLSTKSPHYLYSKLSSVQGETYYKTRYVQNQKENKNIKLGTDSQAEADIARRSFKYRSTSQWNTLPVKIKEAETVQQFKTLLKTWVSENVPIK